MPAPLKLNLTNEERTELQSIADDPKSKKTVVKRAKALLLLDDNNTAEQVTHLLKVSPNSVSDWYYLFKTAGIKGILNKSKLPSKHDNIPTSNFEEQSDENCISDIDRNYSQAKTRLLSNLISYITDLSKKLDSPFLASISLFLSSLLAFLTNLQIVGNAQDYKSYLKRLNWLF